MRLFLAVGLPSEVARALDAPLAGLPRLGWRIVGAEQRHVTLRFLGEQGEQGLRAAVAAAACVAAATAAFEFELTGLGAFPGPARPRVLWAGCGAGSAALGRLAGELQARLGEAGLPPAEGPFRAHVTLARRREAYAEGAAAADLARLAPAAGLWGRAAAGALTLFRSEAGPAGPRYTPLAQLPLAPATAREIP